MPMSKKQHILCLAAFTVVLVNWWIQVAFAPARPSDVYGFWSRLVPLVLGSLAYLIWLGVLVAGFRRRGGPGQPPRAS